MLVAKYSSETSDLQDPHGATSQRTALFIVTAVKTSNLTKKESLQKKIGQ
jgi:hypothetical protein